MKHNPPNKKKKKINIVGIVIFVALMVILGLTVGGKIIHFVKEPEKFRLWVKSTGLWGILFMVAISAFQIIVAVIPGEPIEIASGYAFGWIGGAALCLLGTLVGQTIVFLFAKKFGMDFVKVFVSEKKLNKIAFLKDRSKLYSSIFFIFLIPGTPKDVLSYVAGITPIKLIPFLLVSGLARIPSVVSSTIGGGLLGSKNYKMAIIVFVVTLIISLICFFIYRKIEKSREA